jgi:hypothetical protein
MPGNRETIDQKAARLLTTGRVKVRWVTLGHALVVVEGDSGVWRVIYRTGRWRCPCPAWVARCSHRVAAELVVGRPANLKEATA